MRPSKKDIKAAIDKLKDHKAGEAPVEHNIGKLPSAKNSKRIRKQGI